mmetsp:Transcript_6128/g.13618  ORF Transcript_6128/g.13618 Transcript_6128/m.13618 type:complete len:214 (-) Transcript_6128:43-684(-)|eukprot:CAMPEP_0178421244 /NCGR_PEP_ID=MMETSP0689_2-20121128/26548_1 /TAXON_ID=160604 /ORGANISM="Amphidinium massartii, Strain CS-259" /LENGTH=213 /DNA_ID=CAMNT_0020042751 /DNA_START=744 /DNA_END=1385 /DNA_ORIENTATION=+
MIPIGLCVESSKLHMPGKRQCMSTRYCVGFAPWKKACHNSGLSKPDKVMNKKKTCAEPTCDPASPVELCDTAKLVALVEACSSVVFCWPRNLWLAGLAAAACSFWSRSSISLSFASYSAFMCSSQRGLFNKGSSALMKKGWCAPALALLLGELSIIAVVGMNWPRKMLLKPANLTKDDDLLLWRVVAEERDDILAREVAIDGLLKRSLHSDIG